MPSMTVRELGGYASSDYPGKTMDQVYKMIQRRMQRNERLNHTIRHLANSIRDNGFDPGQPVEVDPVSKVCGQGHYRFCAARILRLRSVPVVYRTLR